MNKILLILKNILLIILIFFHIQFIFIYGMISIKFIIYLILMVLLVLLSIQDIIRKNILNDNKTYLLLFIFVEFILLLIFYRTLYDPSFLYNNQYYLNIIQDGEDVKNINLLYLYKHTSIFILFLLLMIIYYILNTKYLLNQKDTQYNLVTIICFIFSIPILLLVVNSIGTNVYPVFVILTFLLMIVELYYFFHDENKKKFFNYCGLLIYFFTILIIICNFV